MHLESLTDLINVPLFSRDDSGVTVPFNGQEKRSQCSSVKGLYRAITLSLECVNALLRPSLPPSEEATVSSVQDHDPYLEGLLRALQDHK